jgi:hypothetical protein
LFDPNEPGGVWECDLSNPYERVVANELVELAWSQPGENWQNETLDDKPFELREPGEHEVLTREQYKLPEEGLMSITYIQSAVMPKMTDVVSAALFYELVRLMSDKMLVDKGMALVRLAAQEYFFTSEYTATLVCKFADRANRVEATAILLPRTVDVCNWNPIVLNCLNDGEFGLLESRMGHYFNFSPNNPTGHYRLNMLSPADRLIAVRLIQISIEEKKARCNSPTTEFINTSQKGDWDNWRNEVIEVIGDGSGPQAFDFDDSKPTSLPPVGILEFDYVSTNTNNRLAESEKMPNLLFMVFKRELIKVNLVVRVG